MYQCHLNLRLFSIPLKYHDRPSLLLISSIHGYQTFSIRGTGMQVAPFFSAQPVIVVNKSQRCRLLIIQSKAHQLLAALAKRICVRDADIRPINPSRVSVRIQSFYINAFLFTVLDAISAVICLTRCLHTGNHKGLIIHPAVMGDFICLFKSLQLLPLDIRDIQDRFPSLHIRIDKNVEED